MKKIQLKGSLRKELHKAATKSLRKKGRIPAIFYGFKRENIECHLPMIEVLPILHSVEPCFIELMLEGKKHLCIINEVQYHPVNDMPLHVDLLHITEERPIRLEVPIRFTGESPGILKGGELAIKKRAVPVKALPKNMPETLEVDISSLELGEKVTVSAIQEGDYTVLTQPQVPVAVIMIPRSLRSKAAEGKA